MKKTSEVFKSMLSDINSDGLKTKPRDQEIKELINYSTHIENALNLAFDFESRTFSWKYLAAELVRYLSTSLTVENIGKYASLWNKIADKEGTINSNYGFIVFKRYIEDYLNQYTYIVDKLKEDKDSRQALMRYNAHEHVYEGNKDFTCTISNQFFIRENKLDMIINMRSQDIFYGWQFDVVRFGLILQSIRLDLLEKYPELELGKIHYNMGSLHVYESMFEKADNVIKEEPKKDYEFTLKKSFYPLFKDIERNSGEYWDKLSETKDYKQFIIDNLSIDIK